MLSAKLKVYTRSSPQLLVVKQSRASPQHIPECFWPGWQSQRHLERSTSDERNTATTRECGESDLRVERTERVGRARKDAELFSQTILSQWTELERYLGVIELRAADARAGFTCMAGSLASSPEPSAHPIHCRTPLIATSTSHPYPFRQFTSNHQQHLAIHIPNSNNSNSSHLRHPSAAVQP
ncbi:hypothetical protein BD410DRAFT_837339 [Rickenella mellea]|uniref:Uncharacterized protein n=1 Tax=Rickenella mellea TaxID=50990 RepID=A0A4Y7QCV0_9AGAM|nr:hypothetical protein BD410DRAFT_837339 [Rickenella mellea]